MIYNSANIEIKKEISGTCRYDKCSNKKAFELGDISSDA